MSADSLESNIDAPTTGSFEHSADASTRIDVDSSVSNDSGRTVTATTTNIAVSPKLHAVVSTEDSVDNNTEDEFHVGKRYPDLAALTTSVDMYSVNEKVELGLKITKTPCSRVENATHYRWTCKRSGSHKSTAKTRIGRVSLKCGCTCRITATHPLDPSSNGKRLKCVEIAAVSLGHTNGCLGPADTEMNFAVKMRAGRKYTDVFLAHVTREVKMGRYSTRDVKSCLVEYGYRDATLAEATNLRYRIKTGLPIKGWTKEDSKNDAEIGMMEDYLYREELGNLVRKDPKQAVRDLVFMHKGLEQQVPGYMYDIATDSENRFTGTAWQTGRMRARLRKFGAMIFMDDCRSGINDQGFCFWHVVIHNADGKVQTVLGGMTMTASNEAVEYILKALVTFCPEAVEVIEGMLADLGKDHRRLVFLNFSLTDTIVISQYRTGVREEPVKSVLPNCKYVGACAWHIVAIDFTNALKNIHDYQACKKFFVDKLVNSTTCPNEWEQQYRVACQTWPAASEYLNELYRVKQRWGSAWRLDHFTQGKQASSAVEGSFHGFKDWLGGAPKAFAGVVQQHVQKDMTKLAEEKREVAKSKVRVHDQVLNSQRSDAVNECGKDISHNVTEKFAETNIKAQNYVACVLDVSQDEIRDDITGRWSVSRRSVQDENNRRPPRIVTEKNGKKECSCKKDKNSGQPCPHIQCVVNGAYNFNQFHPHWRRTASVEIARVVDIVTPSNLPDATEEAEERPSNEDNSSDLDDSPGTEEPEIDRSHTGFSASDSRAIAQELQGSFITDLSHLSAVPPPGQTQATAISEVVLNSRIQSNKRSGLTGPVSLTYERLEIATSPSSNRLCFNTSAKVQQTPRHWACHRQYCLPGKRRDLL